MTPVRAPANFDDDQGSRRPRIHGDDVQLAPADPKVPRQQGPAQAGEPAGDELLCRIAGTLTLCSHEPIVDRSA